MPFLIATTIILYKCNRTLSVKVPDNFFTHSCPGSDYNIHYNHFRQDDNLYRSFNSCTKIHLPIGTTFFPDPDPCKFLTPKLHIYLNLSEECLQCYETADICLDTGKFYCGKESKGKSVVIAIAVTAVGVGALFFVIYSFHSKLAGLWQNKSKAHQDFEAFLKSHGPPTVRRYSYADKKKIIKSFKEKLGQGYGEVFKGKLDDGCQVAVKILSHSKGNGEEFINEVASISRTSHIVTLFGYCFEGSKRALVYEFLSNGSLKKFIYEFNTSNSQLDIEILYQITIGVAGGLEYLHRGTSDITF